MSTTVQCEACSQSHNLDEGLFCPACGAKASAKAVFRARLQKSPEAIEKIEAMARAEHNANVLEDEAKRRGIPPILVHLAAASSPHAPAREAGMHALVRVLSKKLGGPTIDVDPPARSDYCNGCGGLAVGLDDAGRPSCARCAEGRRV